MTPPLTPDETLFTFTASLIVIPVVFGFVLKAPKLVVFGFLTVIFMFSESSWGELTAESNIYSRGVGIFYFSLLNLTLLVAGAAVLVKRLANPYGAHLAPPMSKYLLAFMFLLFSHLVIGMMSGVDLDIILGPRGILNVLNMLVFMYLVIMAFQNEKDAQRLLYVILALALVRGLFGLARYVWFGGDPANPYRNFDGFDIKILFFDIGDNFVAGLAAFCAAWLLSSSEVRLSFFNRVFLWSLLALEIGAVALSFRRAALLGLGLMFLLLLARLPMRKMIQFGALAAGGLALIAVVFFQSRLQYVGHGASKGILAALMFDVNPNKDVSQSRFYELYAAAQSVGDNWLFGLGTWGKFTGDQDALSYHMGVFDFIHSGFGHIIMKTGVVGLVLFSLLLIAYVSYYVRHRKLVTGFRRLLADAGLAGLLFWIPTLLIGTPIIEFRTMLLIGFTLALPFVAVGLETCKVNNQYAVA
jgi:hypothetical protein